MIHLFRIVQYKTLHQNSVKSQAMCEKKLRDSLTEVGKLSEDEINEVVKDTVEDDFYIKAQETLSSQYKRNKYVHERMCYIEPEEIVLNKAEVMKGLAKDVIHYIPLDAALRNLLEDKSLIKLLEQEKKKTPKAGDVIADILDGSLVK